MSNLKAFLDMIAYAEIGSQLLKLSNNGYNVVVGSTPSAPLLFQDYSDHPRLYIKSMNSTAAGRYQILKRNYDFYKSKLKLKDFSPSSQDAIALQMIKEQGAYKLVEDGKLKEAIAAIKNIWASMPGSPYGQPTKKYKTLEEVYVKAGGTLWQGEQSKV